jgi:hypothetical protein
VVEQAEILEHQPDATAQRGQRILGQDGDVVAEHRDQAARRLERHEQEAQQRGLAGAGRAGQELEGAGRDAKGAVAQHLLPDAVAQADVLEPDHAIVLRPPGVSIGPAAIKNALTATSFGLTPPRLGELQTTVVPAERSESRDPRHTKAENTLERLCVMDPG